MLLPKNIIFKDEKETKFTEKLFNSFFDYEVGDIYSVVANTMKMVSGYKNGLNMQCSQDYFGDFRKKFKPLGRINPVDYLEIYFINCKRIILKRALAPEGNCFETIDLCRFLLDVLRDKYDKHRIDYEFIFDYKSYHVMLRIILNRRKYLLDFSAKGLDFFEEKKTHLPKVYKVIKKSELACFQEYFDCFILFRQKQTSLVLEKLVNLYDKYPMFFVGDLLNKVQYGDKYF